MMKKWLLSSFMVIVCLFALMQSEVSATSWVELEAEEVNERAEVIVRGTYHFSKKSRFNPSNFQPMEFRVNRVYRGDAAEKITVGIDEYDVGWAKEFQEEGGEFLLFLEKGKWSNRLNPVAGPNGMIHLKDGEMMDVTEAQEVVYRAILQGESQAPAKDSLLAFVKRVSYLKVFLVGVLVFGSGRLLVIFLKRK